MNRLVGGVAEGAGVYALATVAEASPKKALIYICTNDRELSQASAALPFFIKGRSVLHFPAWDTLPYDRASPNPTIVSQRIHTLHALAKSVDAPIILTTVAAITQRVMPKDVAGTTRFNLKKNETINHEAFVQFLENAGYRRSGKAMEPGEYALRGSMIDIIPSGEEQGFRLDLFGNTIETIRRFDPFTQRSLADADSLFLEAASEIWLTQDSIECFRTRYREHFGAQQQGSAMYEAISSGARIPGLEFFLPLFYETTATLPDYAPGATLVWAPTTADILAEREALIQDYYDARLRTDKLPHASPYHPLPPAAFYLSESELAAHESVTLTPFEGKTSLRTQAVLAITDSNPYAALKQRLSATPTILAAATRGSADRLRERLRIEGIDAINLHHLHNLESIPEHGVGVAHLPLAKGFATPDFTILTETELLGVRIADRKSKKKTDVFLQEAAQFAYGELVVHREHGIGRFETLETLNVLGAAHDCLKIIYDNDDKLFVPVENMDVLSHFGSETEGVALDKLGAAQWQMRKSRMKERIQLAAEALIKTAAQRALKAGARIHAESGTLEEFSRGFGFAETEDQARAIDDVLADLNSGKPMDRLVCGDVGFGKTEVALRAAFAVVTSHQLPVDSEAFLSTDNCQLTTNRQVAIIVPTSLLARQHYTLFKNRFADFPIRVSQLSRLVDANTQKATKEGIADGTIDIVIGTHALLAKGIEFKNLGLVIVDEEQHFGVKQKERLKELKTDVHVLTLTATPIPRTLQLALSGVRDLSLITTPPIDRLAIRSFVMPFDPVIIREALMREKHRGGRSFIVTPRIADMDDLYKQMRELTPELSFALAHGQMSPSELESIMTKFYDGEVDVLISTSIIESGLDVQTANTIIINRADRFGLGQLYQMRGRVGRGKQRAYAYFIIPPQTITHQAVRRLEVMQTLDRLGAGFTLASHDMDIRGFGNLVGEEQSGHIREVGVELYQHMLEEAIAALKHSGEAEVRVQEWSPQINLGIPVLIPETYVADLELRMGLYKRAASMKTEEEVEALHAEFIDRFGPLPEEVENLLSTVLLKQLCFKAAIARLDVGPKGAVISFKERAVREVEKLITFIGKHPTRLKLKPDQSLVYMEDFEDKTKIVPKLKPFIGQLTAAVG